MVCFGAENPFRRKSKKQPLTPLTNISVAEQAPALPLPAMSSTPSIEELAGLDTSTLARMVADMHAQDTDEVEVVKVIPAPGTSIDLTDQCSDDELHDARPCDNRGYEEDCVMPDKLVAEKSGKLLKEQPPLAEILSMLTGTSPKDLVANIKLAAIFKMPGAAAAENAKEPSLPIDVDDEPILKSTPSSQGKPATASPPAPSAGPKGKGKGRKRKVHPTGTWIQSKKCLPQAPKSAASPPTAAAPEPQSAVPVAAPVTPAPKSADPLSPLPTPDAPPKSAASPPTAAAPEPQSAVPVAAPVTPAPKSADPLSPLPTPDAPQSAEEVAIHSAVAPQSAEPVAIAGEVYVHHWQVPDAAAPQSAKPADVPEPPVPVPVVPTDQEHAPVRKRRYPWRQPGFVPDRTPPKCDLQQGECMCTTGKFDWNAIINKIDEESKNWIESLPCEFWPVHRNGGRMGLYNYTLYAPCGSKLEVKISTRRIRCELSCQGQDYFKSLPSRVFRHSGTADELLQAMNKALCPCEKAWCTRTQQ